MHQEGLRTRQPAGPSNSNLLPLAESPGDLDSGASREMSPAPPPEASTHPCGFSIRNRETRSAGSSPPLRSSLKVQLGFAPGAQIGPALCIRTKAA